MSSTAQSCVGITHLDSGTAVRNPKNPDCGCPFLSPHKWAGFLDGADKGELQHQEGPVLKDLEFHKSSYSGATNNCVEVRETPTVVHMRDTQNRDLGHLSFPAEEWTALLTTTHTEQA